MKLPLDSPRLIRRITLALMAVLAIQTVALALDLVFPPDLRKAERSSPVALDRNGAWLRALPVDNGRWRVRADLKRTDPAYLRAVLAVEDAHFKSHLGVDPGAVTRALIGNMRAGAITSGGSTITMQTARLLHPHPRTVFDKLVEMIRAAQLEARFSKPEILQLYLTLAPYGGNLEGVRAASLSYFGHEPESLTLGEQALLIALPQAPEARRPDRRPAAAQKARHLVLKKLFDVHAISRAAFEEADAEPLPRQRAPFPRLAWHAAGRLARAAPVLQPTVETTLDARLQSRLEQFAAQTAAQQGAGGSVAILVLDSRTRAVRASVGSAGLDRPGGWVDMTRALRSPGSSLKPFVYAFAFDQGLAAPDTKLMDAPTRFGDYQPEDFDRTFHGEVTVKEALTNSLNVPAVATLEKVGPEVFQARLEQAGVRLVRPKARTKGAGLALALGGAGISLQDLSVLYAALADNGVAKPLAWTVREEKARAEEPGARLVRSETAAQIVDILRETPPPAGRAPGPLLARGPRIAFKTGTSYGFRDALAAGIGGDYVVVVWTGRPDGGARGGLTGREAAAPLLFDVFDLIDPPAKAPTPIDPASAPQGLQTLKSDKGDGPALIFPADGASVQVDMLGAKGRGLVLSARGQGLKWYVDGDVLDPDPVSGRVVWRPLAAGFYRVTVVGEAGREAHARVRIKGP